MLRLPEPRGTPSRPCWPRSSAARLAGLPPPDAAADPLAEEDLQLALYLCYELHYRGLHGVDERWEWEPGLLALRAALEERFEAALRAAVGPAGRAPAPAAMDLALRAVADADDGPSLSRHVERDAHAGAGARVPRAPLRLPAQGGRPALLGDPAPAGGAKAALVEIQADEYGGGRPERMHARLFADAMDALGLDARYGAYLDRIPGVTLATVNLMSLCGLHRRLRGAIVGHLALFEMTSSIPNRRYAAGLRRLGVGDPRALAFFDEHVEADAVHENVAAVDLAGGLARAEPELAADICGAPGARGGGARWARTCWALGRGKSLRAPLAGPAAAAPARPGRRAETAH